MKTVTVYLEQTSERLESNKIRIRALVK